MRHLGRTDSFLRLIALAQPCTMPCLKALVWQGLCLWLPQEQAMNTPRKCKEAVAPAEHRHNAVSHAWQKGRLRGNGHSCMQDYAVAHEALSLLGTKMAPAREAAAAAQAEAVGQRLELSYGAQAAVGAATVILGIVVVGGWYWRRRRRLQQFA